MLESDGCRIRKGKGRKISQMFGCRRLQSNEEVMQGIGAKQSKSKSRE